MLSTRKRATQKTKENEKGYLTKNVQVYPYNDDNSCNDSVEATVFIMPSATVDDPDAKAGIPTERYLKVLAMGLEHHGGTKEYIEMLRSHPNIPSTNPSNYGRFPGDDAHTRHPTWSIDEYQSYAKTKNPAFLVRGLVVEIVDPIAEKARIGLLGVHF